MSNDEANDIVALRILQQLCRLLQGEDFIFSPLTLEPALAMLTAGLKGEAETELLQVFDDVEDGQLHSKLTTLLQQFECDPEELYYSLIGSADFDDDVGRIGSEARVETTDLIPNFFPEGLIHPFVTLLMLNGLVLKGSWFEGFHPAEGPMNFKPESGKELQVDFVTKESNEFGYAVTEKLRLIRIPLRDTGFYEVVAMPNNDNDHIDEIIADMQPKQLLEVIADTRSRQYIKLSLPKPRLGRLDHEDLEQRLTDLGARRAFIEKAADLRDMFATPEGARGPSLDPISHESVINVDDKCSKAEAATAISSSANCGEVPLQASIEMEVTRPFLFMIMSEDDSVCFFGLCAVP